MNLQNLSSMSSDLSGMLRDSLITWDVLIGCPVIFYCAVSMQDLLETNLRHLLICLSDSKADLFAVTETWLTHNETTAVTELSIPGYKLLHCPQSNPREGDTEMFFRDCLDVTRVNS